MDTQALTDLLKNGTRDLQLSLTDEQITQLLAYLQLLCKWNTTYNLTAITTPEEMVKLHILDSLAIAPYLAGERHIDIGTGAGLPGIPLSIYFPEKEFSLLDSNGKKTRFLLQVKQELKLKNIEIIHARAENYHPSSLYDTVLSRAFASLTDMVHFTAHLCKENGHFLALKGQYPAAEIAALPFNFTVTTTLPLSVPYIEGQRHLLIISHNPLAKTEQ